MYNAQPLYPSFRLLGLFGLARTASGSGVVLLDSSRKFRWSLVCLTLLKACVPK